VARYVDQLGLVDVQVTYCREPVELLDEGLDADIVVVVDAVISGTAAGTIGVREVDDRFFREWTGTGGTHAVGLGTVVDLARVLGRLPRRLVVVGVEVSAFDTGSGLSERVQASVEEAASTVVALVQERP
jgi:hydrogenase maturation protease